MIAVIDLRERHAPKALVSYDFDRATNDLLKRRARGQWSPQLKSWWVPQNQVTPATHALHEAGYEVQFLGGSIVSSVKAGNLEAATYSFLSELEPVMRRRAFKALALTFHPDTGGDTDVMRSVNDAYGRLKGTA
jgi:hypothetical protein